MKPGPGKFEDCEDIRLAELLCDMGADMELGSVSEAGWYGLIVHRKHAYIVCEDSDGFFTYTRYGSIEEARKEFDEIGEYYTRYYETTEDEEN